MAVRPYSSDYDDSYAGPEETTGSGVAGKTFIWIAWALAAAFWAFTLTTSVGILQAMGGGAADGPGPGEVDAGGLSWMLINVVGGMIILGGALAYGAYRYATRDKGLDAVGEAATRVEYDMVEAAGGDDVVARSPEAHRPLERDVFRAPDPSTGSTRP
jgi:hypothetical protein